MFEYVKNDNGDIFPIIKEAKATEGSYRIGDALVLDPVTGMLKLCVGAVKPQYICSEQKLVTAEDNILHANPVYAGQEWKTQFSEDASAILEGNAVTIDTEGRKVTATTTNGVFTILKKLDTGAVDTYVIGKFM